MNNTEIKNKKVSKYKLNMLEPGVIMINRYISCRESVVLGFRMEHAVIDSISCCRRCFPSSDGASYYRSISG